MQTLSKLVPVVALLVSTACKDLQVPNYNAQSVTELGTGANLAQIGTAAVGMLATSRDFETSFLQSHVALSGEFGREGIELDPSNPQHPIDRLEQIGVGEGTYAGWGTGYKLIRQGNILLGGLNTAVGMTDQQKEAVRGFAKTLQALALNRLVNVFDSSGMPVDVDIELSAPPAAIVTPEAVKTRIGDLLDQAKTHLQAGGASFGFRLTAGFAGFDTPPNFLKFNRALRARNAVYRQDWATALTALGESFIDPAASMRLGAYDIYTAASGDRTNPLFDPTCRQLFSIKENETEAQKRADGVTLDARFTGKIQKFTAKVVHGITVDACFLPLYPTNATAIPIIRNEELLLLRAEALWKTGNTAGAMTDINTVRVNSGSLPALGAFPGDGPFLDELLYNRRYSLIWEGAHRWVDMRRYARLEQLPKALAKHKIFPRLPLPSDECVPRNNPALNCAAPSGY